MILLVGILTFIVVLAVLILVHELGHFTFAKLFGVRVAEFGLGFPPRVKAWRRKETLYTLNLIPLGGFVRMLGENGTTDEPGSFGSKPPWQRFIILVAAPCMNILLALLIFYATFTIGISDGLTVVTSVEPHSPAISAGLRRGDTIVAVDNKSVTYRSDLETAIASHVGRRTVFSVLRRQRMVTVILTPRANPPLGKGAVGIGLNDETTVSYGPLQAAKLSVQQVGLMVGVLPVLLSSVSRHGTGDLQGPIGIAHVTTSAVSVAPQVGPSPLFYLIAFLSANLGVLNLLPIPALDGGRILFVLVAWIRRRNLDPELEGIVHMVGMAILLLLIVVISYQDLVHWIGGSS